MIKNCQPSSARARPLAIATTTLNRIVVVISSPRDACTMKVTAIPHLRNARCRDLAISVPVSALATDRNPWSSDNPFRKSSSASFPASSALRWDVKPHSRNLMPIGLLLRRISQHQPGSFSVRKTTMSNDLRGEGRSMINPDPVDHPSRFARCGQPFQWGMRAEGPSLRSPFRSTPPRRLRGGPEGDSRHPIRSPAGGDHLDRFRSSAGACAPGFSGTGYCRAGCHSIFP